MHVLIPVLHRPDRPTGVCRHGANLAQCLAGRDEVTQVTVIIGAWQADYFASNFNISSPKIKLVEVDIKNSSLARNAWFLFGLPKLANQLQADVVHLSFPLPFVRQWFKSPVVATIHDLYPFECPENFGYPQVWFNQWFLRQCVANADGLSCVSQVTLNALLQYFPRLGQRVPLTVIYNSVDFQAVKPLRPSGLELLPGQGFALCVAQHRKNKNLDLLIRAFVRLTQDSENSALLALVLVGSPGPETAALKDLAHTLGLQSNIHFLSALEDAELRWLYEQCALFAIPSVTEGFCLPLVEAQALGCRVVCSDIPIFQEVAGAGCYVFPLQPDAVTALAQTIQIALTRPKPQSGGMNPKYLPDHTAQQYLKLYDQVLTQ